MVPYTTIILPFLVSFLVTAILTPFSIKLMRKLGIMDDPKIHKHPGIIHTKPIPRGGGLPLFLGVFTAAAFFLPINNTTVAIFVAALLALIIGLIDDKLNAEAKDVSPYLRFGINILTAIIVVGSGVSIHFITNPFGPGVIHLDAMKYTLPFLPITILLSDFVSVIWLIWVMNMLNFSKGIDGQMPGIVAISAIVIGILSLQLNTSGSGGYIDSQLSFIISGAAVGFLLFNFYPAKIFPGYGATFLYLLLGIASILTSAKLATAILVMGVPMVDFIFIIIRRIITKRDPFKGDKKHLHHLLLTFGWSQRRIALFYWSISAILGIISLSLTSTSKPFTLLMVMVLIGGALLFLHSMSKKGQNDITS